MAALASRLQRPWPRGVGNFHQARLGENLPASSVRLQQTLQSITLYLQQHGSSPVDAAQRATAMVGRMFDAQVRILAYMDCFYAIGVLTLIVAPLALYTRNFKIDPDASPGH